jgi:hypothetical protein
VPRSIRQIAVADHLWDLYGRMADEMGSDRDALVNEAMHAYARLHGYVAPGGAVADAGEPRSPSACERRLVTERVLDTAERLERDIGPRPTPVSAPAAPPPLLAVPPLPPAGLRPGVLALRREDGAVVEVHRDRFVVGRGGHCDLVIDSAKISREHAAFTRAEGGWWIEDLGSSNGTWFRGERVTRRRVEHGDEYFLCAEKIRCALR